MKSPNPNWHKRWIISPMPSCWNCITHIPIHGLEGNLRRCEIVGVQSRVALSPNVIYDCLSDEFPKRRWGCLCRSSCPREQFCPGEEETMVWMETRKNQIPKKEPLQSYKRGRDGPLTHPISCTGNKMTGYSNPNLSVSPL